MSTHTLSLADRPSVWHAASRPTCIIGRSCRPSVAPPSLPRSAGADEKAFSVGPPTDMTVSSIAQAMAVHGPSDPMPWQRVADSPELLARLDRAERLLESSMFALYPLARAKGTDASLTVSWAHALGVADAARVRVWSEQERLHAVQTWRESSPGLRHGADLDGRQALSSRHLARALNRCETPEDRSAAITKWLHPITRADRNARAAEERARLAAMAHMVKVTDALRCRAGRMADMLVPAVSLDSMNAGEIARHAVELLALVPDCIVGKDKGGLTRLAGRGVPVDPELLAARAAKAAVAAARKASKASQGPKGPKVAPRGLVIAPALVAPDSGIRWEMLNGEHAHLAEYAHLAE